MTCFTISEQINKMISKQENKGIMMGFFLTVTGN